MSVAVMLCRNRFVALGIIAAGCVITILASETPGSVPFLVLFVACITSSRLITIGMESGCLVEWNELARMCRTEDMTTVPTMVFANKEVEVGFALR